MPYYFISDITIHDEIKYKEYDLNLWYYSKEYQEIINHRLGGALCNTLVKGL